MTNETTTLPEWVTETPGLPKHLLAIIDYETTGSTLQEIELTPDEYEKLKQYLATLRGYCLESAPQIGKQKSTPTESGDAPRALWGTARPEDDTAFRAELETFIAAATAEMSASDLLCVARCVDIVTNRRGCDTPAEEFITDLVMHHYCREGDGLTPEDVAEALKTFEADFADAVKVTKLFNRTYRETLKEPNA